MPDDTPPFPRPQPSNLRPPRKDSSILLAACSLFAGRARHDAEERHVFAELARNLLPNTPTNDRRRIASLLARHPDCPPDLLAALADDEDSLTAYPILQHVPNLPQEIILRQIERGPDSVRKAIAERPDLGKIHMDALCRLAGDEVVRSLLARGDVKVDARSSALLLARRSLAKGLRADMLGALTLTPDILMRNFPYLSADLQQEAIAAAELENIVNRTAGLPPAATKCTAPSTGLENLAQFSMSADRTAVADTLKDAFGWSQDTIRHIVSQDHGAALAVALKALGADVPAATTVMMRLAGERLNLTAIRRALNVYQSVSFGAAAAIAGSWATAEPAASEMASPDHDPVYAEHQTKRPATRAATGPTHAADWMDTDLPVALRGRS